MAHPESKGPMSVWASREFYAIGGLRPENQNGSEQCLLVDMKTNVIRMKANMSVGRIGPGVIMHINYIYVCGGLKTLSEVDRGQLNPSPEKTCERYNITTNQWEDMANLGEGAKASPTLVIVKGTNWLYQIGGNFGDDCIYRLNL
jgi:hypothetical protein